MARIDPIRFGVAGGILSAAAIFVFTLIAELWGFGAQYLGTLQDIFIGYEISVVGSVIGAIYGFIVGFFELFVIAFIYNLLGLTK